MIMFSKKTSTYGGGRASVAVLVRNPLAAAGVDRRARASLALKEPRAAGEGRLCAGRCAVAAASVGVIVVIIASVAAGLALGGGESPRAALGESGVDASSFSASATLSLGASPSASLSASLSIGASPSATPAPTGSGSASASPLPLPRAIVVSANASSVELWSARMLSERLGVPLSRNVTQRSPAIAIGFEAAVEYGIAAQTLAPLGADDYLVTSVRGLSGGSVAVASSAGSARGSLFGTFHLLRALGFEFFTRNVTRVPPRPYALPPLGIDALVQPPMYLRDIAAAPLGDNRARIRGANGSVTFPPANLSAALGLNGVTVNLPIGGFVGAGGSGPPGFVHTAYNLLAPSLDADSASCAGAGLPAEPHAQNTPCPATVRAHPEWIICRNAALPPPYLMWPCSNETPAGITYNSQPCWSLPSLQAAMADSIRRIVRAQPATRVVSVDTMDGTPTFCPPDEALNAYENTTGGANMHAVNNIAANLSAEFPDLVVQTLGYGGAHAPPARLRLVDNAQVRVSPPMDDFLSLYHPANAQALAEARGWLRAVKTLTIWDNCDNFVYSIAPYPNYFMLATHVIELFRLGFKGYFAAGLQLAGADMADLKTFVTARAMFDPLNVDLRALAGNFSTAVYGPGAPGVMRYLDLMEASFQNNDRTRDYNGRLNVRGASRHLTPWNAAYANRTLLDCGAALKAAEAAATAAGPLFRDAVRHAILPLQYVVLLRWVQLRAFAAAERIAWPFESTPAAEFALFNTTFVRIKVYSFFHSDEYPSITTIACDLVCFHRIVFGF